MLGEHVFIELDYGTEEKEGIWIPNNFIVSENVEKIYTLNENCRCDIIKIITHDSYCSFLGLPCVVLYITIFILFVIIFNIF